MTLPPPTLPPPTPPNSDELVSAYLDGEATPAEIAQVKASPELLARVEAMRAVAEELSMIPAAPAELKEIHIAAALGVFDDLMVTKAATLPASAAIHPTEPPGAAVTSLDQAREKRRPRRVNALAVAAAAIAAVFIGVTAISLSTSSNSSDLADSSAEAADDSFATSTDTAPDSASADATESPEVEQSIEAQAAPLAPEDSATTLERLPGATGDGFDQPSADEPAADAAMNDAEPGEADLDDAQAAQAPAAAEESEGLADEAPDASLIVPFGLETSKLYLGFVAGQNDLALRLEQRAFVEPEIFDFETCQDSIAELEESGEPTLIAVAILDDRLVEVHQIPDATTQLIIDQQTCEVVDELAR